MGVGVHIGVDEARQAGVLLPENDPVACEDEKEYEKPRRPDYRAKVAHHLKETRRRLVARFARIAEEQKDEEKHRENAESGDAKNPFESKVGVRPIGDEGAGGAADVDHGVVDGVTEGADIFLGSAGGSAEDAGFYKRDAERGKYEDDSHK